jgi:uncharacterized protein YukE
MSEFEVTTDDLHVLAGHLSGLLSGLTQATGNISSESAGVAGAPQLEAAISGFVSDWSAGLQELHSALDTLSRRLGDAATSYESAESDIGSHLEGVAGHLLGR